jgi:hypothetical protein
MASRGIGGQNNTGRQGHVTLAFPEAVSTHETKIQAFDYK